MVPRTRYARSGEMHIAYEWPPTRDEREAMAEAARADWGSGARALGIAGGRPTDRLREWAGRLERLAASPATPAALTRMHSETDVRAVLPSIQAPTLVLHHREDQFIDVRHRSTSPASYRVRGVTAWEDDRPPRARGPEVVRPMLLCPTTQAAGFPRLAEASH